MIRDLLLGRLKFIWALAALTWFGWGVVLDTETLLNNRQAEQEACDAYFSTLASMAKGEAGADVDPWALQKRYHDAYLRSRFDGARIAVKYSSEAQKLSLKSALKSL